MSLTLVAAGVSVQDALSGIAVVKEGLGDMAVSNAIGSNIFDVLICLGAPWLVKTLFLQPGQEETFTIPLTEGTCLIGMGGEHPDLNLTVAPGGQREWTWTPDAPAAQLAPGPVTLTLRNPN